MKPRTLGLLAKRTLCAGSVVYSVKRTSTISLGLCPDWEAWDPNQPVQNAREAMQQADDWLGVPQVHWASWGIRWRGDGEGRTVRIPGQEAGGIRRALCHHHFSLRQVIAPEEIVDPNVDEHSVMTYLSQFPKAKLKPGAPVRSKQLNPKKAIAYGPGMC